MRSEIAMADRVPEPDLVTPLLLELAGQRVLLQRASELMGEVLTEHIYDASNGEAPEADCPYTKLVADIDAALKQGN